MTDFTQEIKHLQKLSCISLSPEEENKFWTQLSDIIEFLWKLPESKVETPESKVKSPKLTLRTIAGVKTEINTEKILKNVKHAIINNSIVIKSVLN
jgi:aspartyl/glutamyl-tRNA(Asn/Gln) amidotransferase C subunit